jgi:hypothetical protein
MSMSTHVSGFRPPDERWRQMKAVYDASKAAGLDPPEEVMEFFGWSAPDEAGVEVDLDGSGAVREWKGDFSRAGFEIDVRNLPSDLHILRFYNSW